MEEGFSKRSDEEVKKLAHDPRYIHFAGMIGPPRLGVRECIMKLEYTHYIPGTPRNDDCIVHMVKWGGIEWVIISIPKEDRHLMEKVADECGLRIADGVPTAISDSSKQQFPMNSETVFTLENKSGHPIYLNDPTITEAMLKAEEERMEKIEQDWISRN